MYSPDLLLEAHEGERLLDEPIRQVKARRIVIDSLNHLQMYLKENKDVRREAYRILMGFKTKGITSISIWEMPQLLGDSLALTDVGMSFVVDSIVLLRLVEIESSMRKVLVVLKMRGSDHDKRLREFEITSRGLIVGQPFSGYESVMTGNAKKSFGEETTRAFAKAFSRKR